MRKLLACVAAAAALAWSVTAPAQSGRTGTGVVNPQFIQSGTGAKARAFLDKAREVVSAKDFGAVGNGVADDTTPLTNLINYLLTNQNAVGELNAGSTYVITSALPTINKSRVTLHAAGRSGIHDVGTLFSGAVIRYTGAAGATMLTIAPDSGAGNQFLSGVNIIGIGFDANNLAAKGVVIKSVRYGDIDIGCANATNTCLEFDVQTTLGEARDPQGNSVRYVGRQIEAASGVSLRLKGDPGANTSFNRFELVDIVHKDAAGVVVENADNNFWGVVRVYRAAGGTAPNSIIWQGGVDIAQKARAEYIGSLSATVAAIAKGTPAYASPAVNIVIANLDTDNGTPQPTIETDASVYWFNAAGALRGSTATLVGGTLGTGGTTALSLTTSGGTVARFNNVASGVNFYDFAPGIATDGPFMRANGSDTNITSFFQNKGTGGFRFTNGSQANYFAVSSNGLTAPDNHVQVSAAATGSAPQVQAQGVDAAVPLDFATKGAAGYRYLTNTSVQQFAVAHTASATRWLIATGSNGGNPSLTASAGSVSIDSAAAATAGLTVSGANDTTVFTSTGGSVTGAGTTSFNSLTGTWNTTGVVPGALKLNVTNTASGAGSRLLELQRGGTLQFGVTSGAAATGTQVRTAQATAPTCSASCGTSPSVAGSDSAMIVTMGATGSPASPFTVTFNGTWAAAPSCIAQSAKTGMVVGKMPIAVVTTTTTVVVTTNGTAPATTDVYAIHCFGVQ